MTNSTDIIKLSICGEPFHITKLTAKKSGFLKNLIETIEEDTSLTENEEIYIESDKGAFTHILHWLRKGEIYLEEKGALRNLRDEAIFYQIDDLQHAIDNKLMQMSKKEVFSLVEPSELERFPGIRTSNTSSSQEPALNYRFITTVHYTERKWKCPRYIFSHTKPYYCGRKCRNTLEDNTGTGWVYEEKVKYLIAEYA
jgi:hypothetical protein